jgi:small subunit ribosomal protein S14
MAKNSSVINNNKKLHQINLHRDKRFSALDIIKNPTNHDLMIVLLNQKFLDRTTSHTVYRNRCQITGKPRGYIGKVGMCRNAFRHYASFGLVMGVKKCNN